jgi:hypothetical protein
MENVNEYEKFRKPIQDIINFSNTIEEKYQQKTFEILFIQHLSGSKEVKLQTHIQEKKVFQVSDHYPFDLRTFLQQNSISEEMINKLFLRENGEIQPSYKIVEKRTAVAQIQVSLLTAFENALASPCGALEFPMKKARERCIDYNVYNGNDFIFNFRKFAGLFTNIDYEVVKLTPVGKTELASLIISLSKL